MTIPKRFEEVVQEQNQTVPVYTASVTTLEYKTGGTVAGLFAEATLDGARIGYLTAERLVDGSYILDGVYVVPEYRNAGVGMNLVRKAHQTAAFTPYVLTDNQVYQSEAGRRIAEKEYEMVTASSIHTAGPLALLVPAAAEAVAGLGAAGAGAAAAEGAAGLAGAAGAAEGAAAAEGAGGGAGLIGKGLKGLAKGIGKGIVKHEVGKALTPGSSGQNGTDTGGGDSGKGSGSNINSGTPKGFSDVNPYANLPNPVVGSSWVQPIVHGLEWLGGGMLHPLHHLDVGNMMNLKKPGSGTSETLRGLVGGGTDLGLMGGASWLSLKGRGSKSQQPEPEQVTKSAPKPEPKPGNSFYHQQLGQMTDEGLIHHVLTDPAPWDLNPHWPERGPKEGSVNLEIELLQGLNQLKEMMSCQCGAGTRGRFMGMPHCNPGEGCCANTDPSSHACGSCGNPAATGDHMGMALCKPGEPGCNQRWTPDSESDQEKIQHHTTWALNTNHGEEEESQAPMQMAASTWINDHSNLDSDW